jgi:hypothetical protein
VDVHFAGNRLEKRNSSFFGGICEKTFVIDKVLDYQGAARHVLKD